MQQRTCAQARSEDSTKPRRTLRITPFDKFDLLVAASQAEDICPIWITDRLSETERVLP